jgi:hypothetical protein
VAEDKKGGDGSYAVSFLFLHHKHCFSLHQVSNEELASLTYTKKLL